MKRIGQGLLVLAVAAGVALADDIEIKATQKTESSDKGSTQTLPGGTSRSVRTEKYYKFELRRMSSAIPSVVNVAWAVFKEGVGGKIELAAHGEETVSLPIGQEVALKSSTVLLTGREWTGRRDGDFGEDLAGYGVRITDRNGEVVAERYDPSSVQAVVEKLREKKAEAEAQKAEEETETEPSMDWMRRKVQRRPPPIKRAPRFR